LDEGGVLGWRMEAPQVDAGPILFASEEEAKRLGTFSGRRNTALLLPCMEYSAPLNTRLRKPLVGARVMAN
jgi:hypothetical protein